ncbi:MAG: MFS transporter, partial [Anaerolineae bacterium]|nr:MFS transporter [Anaerolineae bacterium]
MAHTDATSTNLAAKPRLFYGWLVVAACAGILPLIFAVRQSFTLFYDAFLTDFGWTRADTSLIFTTSMVVFALTSTAIGLLINRFGVRLSFSIAAVLAATGMLLSSRSNSLLALSVSWGVIGGLGVTGLGLGQASALVSRWFRRQRGIAVGLAFAGIGLGVAAFVPLTGWLIRDFGWRWAFVGLAGLVTLIVPLSLLLHDRPEQIGLHPDGDAEAGLPTGRFLNTGTWTLWQALRTPSFWLVFASGLGSMGPLRMLTLPQVTVFADAGFDQALASNVLGVSGLVLGVAYVVSGWLSDRVGRPALFTFGSVCILGGFVIFATLHPGTPVSVLYLYAMLAGLAEGTRASLLMATASDLFPGPSMGAISGSMGAAMSIGAAYLPWLSGRMFDTSGSYVTSYWIGTAVLVVTTLTLWLAVWLRPT